MIGKGPKCGIIYPLHTTSPARDATLFWLFSSPLNNECQLWHKRPGHSNAQKLSFMLNGGLLMNKISCSLKDVIFDRSTCKLGKSKALPFSTHKEISTNCFDLIRSDV